MAYRLTEAGVPLIQVNLGNNETWDTHGEAFSRFKNKLFPPTDRALCALLDDLEDSGLLESTMIVMAGEFGRTPKLSTLEKVFYKPGRDHWGAVQTAFFAGGGVKGGIVHGESDEYGIMAHQDAVHTHDLHATMLHLLGLDHESLTYRYAGRDFRLTDVHGEIIRDIIA